MLDNFEKCQFSAGQTIFSEGDDGVEMFIIDSGRVRIWRGAAGKEHVLGYIEQGSIFGEMALINNKPRIASATADSDVVCFVVSKQDFQERYQNVNSFVKTIVKILAINVNSLSDYIEENNETNQ